MIIFAIIYLYPFLIQLVTSFKTNADATDNPLGLVPDPFNLAAFERLGDTDFPLWFVNSTWVAVSRHDRPGVLRLAGRVRAGADQVQGAVGAVHRDHRGDGRAGRVLLIPKFLVLNQLSMYDSPSALVVPLLADAAGVFIMKQFFESIPVSVEEAARIDGASTFRTFWSVVLPMARPALITLTILSFQASWNELPHFIVASQDPGLYTLTKGVATLTSGQLGVRQPVPDHDGGRAPDDHPGRDRLRDLPALLRPRRQRWRREGLTVLLVEVRVPRSGQASGQCGLSSGGERMEPWASGSGAWCSTARTSSG